LRPIARRILGRHLLFKGGSANYFFFELGDSYETNPMSDSIDFSKSGLFLIDSNACLIFS